MKTYEFLKLTLGDFLRLLQQKTKENADKMQEIYDYTIEIKKNEADTEERKIKLKNALMMNNEFISINRKYIDVHNYLMQVLNEWAQNEEIDPTVINNHEPDESELQEEEKIILNNQIKADEQEFNLDNPALQDKDFVNQLMEKYLEEEEYEKCGELQKIIDLNNFCEN